MFGSLVTSVIAADAARIAVIFFGGAVVGAGWPILWHRAHFYRQIQLPDACVAMWLLAVVNALVLTFISFVLIDRWGDPLSWRWPVAIAIFGLKGWFFLLLRKAGLEQERRVLRDSHQTGQGARITALEGRADVERTRNDDTQGHA